MSKDDLFRPVRFSLVVFEQSVFDAIVEEFEETNVPTDISIILADALNSTITNEFVLPRTDGQTSEPYFVVTKKIEEVEREFINDSFFEKNPE